MSKIYDDFIEKATPIAKELLLIKELTRDETACVFVNVDGVDVALTATVVKPLEEIAEPQQTPTEGEYIVGEDGAQGIIAPETVTVTVSQ